MNTTMTAVVPVRAGLLPAGGSETIAEAGGRVVLCGSGCRTAAEQLGHLATEIRLCEASAYAPASWATALAPLVADASVVVLPASPDGRDLAPRLADVLDRELFTGALQVTPACVTVTRHGGRVQDRIPLTSPAVVTLQPGVRGADPQSVVAAATIVPVDAEFRTLADPCVVEELPPDPASIDLAEASRIVGGGAGLDGAERFELLRAVGLALGASMGATRVITDRGWIAHERQIGTTGVAVSPRLYLSFGISGAIQHTAGLGAPEHIISVNTDPHCPMMAMSDVAIVADANAVLEALAQRLEARP